MTTSIEAKLIKSDRIIKKVYKFHVNILHKTTCLKYTYRLYGKNYRAAKLLTLYLIPNR